MNTRIFGRSGRAVGEIGLGTWQLGSGWGEVDEATALDTLRAAYEQGVTFFDTADVYGDGLSEERIARFFARTPGARERVFVATKLGRFSTPGWPGNFTREAVRAHTEASLRRLGADTLDLTQLHCVPHAELRKGTLFGWLEELKAEGKIRAYGVSVESMDEAVTCLDHGGPASLQIIFNLFRQKPITTIFERAKAQQVALIVRLPLASGLLGGRMTKATTFAATDHRLFNRDGQCFNVGETFAGLPFELGVELAEGLKPLLPAGVPMADAALRWCLDFEAVTVLIPGARNVAQAVGNTRATDVPPLTVEQHQAVAEYYRTRVAPHIRGPY